ncbi:MAG: hypothetical protein E6H48_16400 [Betaproteobacteria bacterium]|nr:MAG: hypothetical protein E6H48_16400 [Betaproteobacteria bacterium]
MPGGSMLDLGTLGGSNGSGTAINVSGQIAGFAETSSGSTHAFRYSSGTMVDLGVLAGGSFSAGFGIDNNGQVVGFADISGLTDSRGVHLHRRDDARPELACRLRFGWNDPNDRG